jgi:lipopolysaccharide export system protein LptA
LIRILSILILLLPIWVGNAFANKSDQDKPLIVNADQVDVDDVKQSYQLSGDVLLIKGSMIAKGDKGTILVDPQGYQNIDLKGRLEAPASMRQRREGLADEFMQGVGRDVFYDDKKEQIILTGHATIKRLLNMQMLDQLQGWQIEYEDIKESYKVRPQKVDAKAQPQSRAILAPRKKAVLN